MLIFGAVFLVVIPFFFFDYLSRYIFVAIIYKRRYDHGKTWKKAYNHYKKSWAFCERMLWVPVFKEAYSFKIRLLAYLAYVHTVMFLFASVVTIISMFLSVDSSFAFCIYFIFFSFSLIRLIWNSYVANRVMFFKE